MENIPTIILYFIAWAMYRIVLHDQKENITNWILIYNPFRIRCAICIWYNLGILEGIIHLIFIMNL